MVITFHVLWFICLSFSLVHFKNGPEYLTRSTAQVFIPLIRFLQHSFVSSSFLDLLRCSFHFLNYYYYYYYYYYFTHLRVFHISVSWWFSTGVWVTASLLTFPGLFSIMADFNNAVVWMVSTRPLISKSSISFTNPLTTVPSSPYTIGIIITFVP